MRYAEFKQWLQQWTTSNPAVRSSALSRCRRVEDYEGDLDVHFATDRMATLLARLVYSADDERFGVAPRHCVPIPESANLRSGTASLASATRRYVEFCDAWPSGTALEQAFGTMRAERVPNMARQAVRASRRATPLSTWPQWEVPSKDHLLELATVTARYIRFLHPDVVQCVVEDNEDRREDWYARLLERGVDPEVYLWRRSASTFPGVRRYIGNKEKAQYRNRMKTMERPAGALAVDDNDYPKALWSYVFRGKGFQNQGPVGYSLAHLADHKRYKNRARAEFDLQDEAAGLQTLFGLFSSAANTVYMPDGLIRPTDFSFVLRNLIQRQANRLYGSFCNLLPPNMAIKDANSGDWSLDNFAWCEPVGTVANMGAFLAYRNQEMERLLSL